MEYLRNKMTSEVRPVEPGTQEWIDLIAEVGPDGEKKWEQQGAHQVAAVQDRAAADELHEHDLGKKDQANLPSDEYDSSKLRPETNHDLQLTPGEVEAGLTPQLKAEHKGEQFGTAARTSTLTEAAGRILNDEVPGGGTPLMEEVDEPYEQWTLKDLKEEYKARGLSGVSGNAKQPYADALNEDDDNEPDDSEDEEVELTDGEKAAGLSPDDKSETPEGATA